MHQGSQKGISRSPAAQRIEEALSLGTRREMACCQLPDGLGSRRLVGLQGDSRG